MKFDRKDLYFIHKFHYCDGSTRKTARKYSVEEELTNFGTYGHESHMSYSTTYRTTNFLFITFPFRIKCVIFIYKCFLFKVTCCPTNVIHYGIPLTLTHGRSPKLSPAVLACYGVSFSI